MSHSKGKKVFAGMSPIAKEDLATGQAGGSRKKVFVGMSGGVDSSVSAALLKEQGYDVTGVFIKVWSPEFLPCDWKAERRDAMRVAAHLGIPFETLDLEEEYKREVADYMIEEYRRGRTPNPDVMCNRSIKFGGFLKYALENGADFIATGHYCQIQKSKIKNQNDNSKSKTEEIYKLYEGVDKNKDQSYFLWTLTQDQLKHVLFPVGALTKPEVRKEAERFGLPTAAKKDSQGVCFLGPLDMHDFLAHYIEPKRGDVLNERGEIIGFHDGAFFLTLGKRHGFTITAKTPNDAPLYIVAKDIERNTITVSSERGGSDGEYAVHDIELESVSWTADRPHDGERLLCRFRYRQDAVSCEVLSHEHGLRVHFDEPQSAVSPGQSLVLYRGEECIGGGVIRK
ncbi:MAG TPA: tRNA 2-thiouridine(34) synthase MnmA [Candidatus Paceibacterota bacterium]|nr:tRNA 2-thiouridine(34) synthase MnmA [Candidatus Paceibacterota bacterium]